MENTITIALIAGYWWVFVSNVIEIMHILDSPNNIKGSLHIQGHHQKTVTQYNIIDHKQIKNGFSPVWSPLWFVGLSPMCNVS